MSSRQNGHGAPVSVECWRGRGRQPRLLWSVRGSSREHPRWCAPFRGFGATPLRFCVSQATCCRCGCGCVLFVAGATGGFSGRLRPRGVGNVKIGTLLCHGDVKKRFVRDCRVRFFHPRGVAAYSRIFVGVVRLGGPAGLRPSTGGQLRFGSARVAVVGNKNGMLWCRKSWTFLSHI